MLKGRKVKKGKGGIKMDNTIVGVLNAMNCPCELYGAIWGYIPHNDKPPISQAEIQKQHVEINARRLILSAGLSYGRLAKFMNFAGNFTKAISIIKEMNDNRELRKTMSVRDIIPIGPYVVLRGAIRNDDANH